MAYKKDPRVDAYIATLPKWQQVLAQKVRNIVHAADADVEETIKRTDKPYFVLQGNICALLGAKNHLNIFIYDPIAPDTAGLINQGQNNQTARSIQLYEGDFLDEKALQELLTAVIANNKSGGWRKLSAVKRD